MKLLAVIEDDPSVEAVRDGLIGHGDVIHTPFGVKPLTYADFTASGRMLIQV